MKIRVPTHPTPSLPVPTLPHGFIPPALRGVPVPLLRMGKVADVTLPGAMLTGDTYTVYTYDPNKPRGGVFGEMPFYQEDGENTWGGGIRPLVQRD